MAQFTLSKEPHRLHGPLSEKISAMRRRFDHAANYGVPIAQKEMAEILVDFREMVVKAEELETRRDPVSVATVSYHLVAQVGDELLVLRSLLAEMMHTPQRDDDCSEQIVCAFARARALLEKGEAVFVGKTKS